MGMNKCCVIFETMATAQHSGKKDDSIVVVDSQIDLIRQDHNNACVTSNCHRFSLLLVKK